MIEHLASFVEDDGTQYTAELDRFVNQIIVTGRRRYQSNTPDLFYRMVVDRETICSLKSFGQETNASLARDAFHITIPTICEALDHTEKAHLQQHGAQKRAKFIAPEDPDFFARSERENRKMNKMLEAERKAKEARLSQEREALESNPLYGLF